MTTLVQIKNPSGPGYIVIDNGGSKVIVAPGEYKEVPLSRGDHLYINEGEAVAVENPITR